MAWLGELTSSYNTFSCGNWLLDLSVFSNILLTQMYVTINVMIAVTVTDTMKVTTNVMIAIDTELQLSDPLLSAKYSINHL